MTHDLLLSKHGVACPASHVLKQAITRHKARLSAELTKIRLKEGFSTIEAFRAHINSSKGETVGQDGTPSGLPAHPRWIRVNAVKTTLDAQLATTFADFTQNDSLFEVLSLTASAKLLYIDQHIPDLIAVHPSTDLSKHPAYLNGEIIFQDKASCFPAYLLNIGLDDGDVIDACAAPGNKTTHLAALLHSLGQPQRRVFAFERDKNRSEVLQRMTATAGASDTVTVFKRQDFLESDPHDPVFEKVTSLLLDPSCSGSGIVGRDDTISISLPSQETGKDEGASSNGRGTKRKRDTAKQQKNAPPVHTSIPPNVNEADDVDNSTSASLQERLKSLASFQLRIIQHAMQFSSARRITYSTCSIHAEENEHVVLRALAAPVAKEREWRIQKRDEQPAGMKAWDVRGVPGHCQGDNISNQHANELANACIRCEKGTDKGTMGFFVACFIREGDTVKESENDEEEWEGFSDT